MVYDAQVAQISDYMRPMRSRVTEVLVLQSVWQEQRCCCDAIATCVFWMLTAFTPAFTSLKPPPHLKHSDNMITRGFVQLPGRCLQHAVPAARVQRSAARLVHMRPAAAAEVDVEAPKQQAPAAGMQHAAAHALWMGLSIASVRPRMC